MGFFFEEIFHFAKTTEFSLSVAWRTDMILWLPKVHQHLGKRCISKKAAGCYLILDSNYLQISTIDVEAMELRCRTVDFVGFLKGIPSAAILEALLGGTTSDYGGDGALNGGYYYGDCVMKMITDSRSGKVREASTSFGG